MHSNVPDGRASQLQALLLEDVEADEAQVADIFLHQIRNVVVAHEQHIERQILAKTEQLILAARELEPAAAEQLQ